MKTKTILLYSFDELSEEGKKKALSNLYDINVDHEWWQCTIDYMKEKLSEIGFVDAVISFSGFSSQGDGASFDTSIDLTKFCNDKRILAIAESYCDFRIEKNSFANHYSHKRTRRTEYNALDEKFLRIGIALQNLSDDIESKRLSLCDEIYSTLEKEYNYLTSEESIIKTIKSNDYTFTENGKLEN